MNNPVLTPCDKLNTEDRARRLAMSMYHVGHGEVKLKTSVTVETKRVPGTCMFCEARLADTWRGVKYIDGEPGKFVHIRAGHDAASYEAFKAALCDGTAKPTRDDTGFIGGYQVVQVVVCDGLMANAVWDRAQAIVREKAADVMKAAKDELEHNEPSHARKNRTAAALRHGDF